MCATTPQSTKDKRAAHETSQRGCHSRKLTGVAALLALLSSALWGASEFFGGALSRRRPALAVIGFGQVAGLAAMLVIATVMGVWDDPVGYLPWAVIAALCDLGGLWAFYLALSIGRMGVVAPIVSAGIAVPLISGLLIGDRPDMPETVGIVLAIVGLFIVVSLEKDDEDEEESRQTAPNLRRSVILAAVAALLLGGTVAAIARGSLDSPIMTLTAMRVTSVLAMLIIAVATRSIGGMRGNDIFEAGGIGLLDTAANVCYALAAGTGALVVTAVLGSLPPVMTLLLAWWLLHERLQKAQYWGVALALVGVVLMSLP